jgi:hypothetical protein
MIYRIVSYDRVTERMKGSLIVPPSMLEQIKAIAGFQPQDDGFGEYPLDEEQTRQVSSILGFRPEPDRFYYSVEPFEPPEDSGFNQQMTGAQADES